MSLYLGIDFGTSTNVVTRWNETTKRADVVPLGKYGNANIFSNVIYYESPEKIFVGDYAVEKGKLNPENAVFYVKRLLESSNFRRHIPALGFDRIGIEIAADIFTWIKREVEQKFGGEKIDGAVISVPFAFQNAERSRIESAAKQAGLVVLGLIEEPVAAAISFGLTDKVTLGKDEKILVFDLGGGTFDVTIFDFRKRSDLKFSIKVITTGGNKHLGGIDIDDEVIKKIRQMLDSQYTDYHADTRERNLQEKEIFQIRQLAVELKEILSADDDFDLIFESKFDERFSLQENVERTDFDGWLKRFLADIENVLTDTLRNADLKPVDIDRIIMVGGTSNIPAIKEKVRKYFGKEAEHYGAELTLMVGKGAGIYCGLKYVEKTLDCEILICTCRNIGIKFNGQFIEMLPKNTLYGTPSEMKVLTIKNTGRNNIEISLVEGNRVRNVKIGSINVSVEIQRQLDKGRLGLIINTDTSNGIVNYELHRVVEKNNNFVSDKILLKEKIGG